jgi:putative phosphoserine phosphatase/1-acylglycerol-3-phosphate O-acyltransferase
MTSVAELDAAIRSAPRGPQVAAFFDYDGTVIHGFSAKAFYTHRMRHREIGPIELSKTLWKAVRGIDGDDDFAAFLEMSLASWNGKTVEEMTELGEQLFKHDIAGDLHHEVWELIAAHHAMGHTIVLASSATRFQIEPMAREIGAHHALCTPLEVVDGVLTGKTAGPPLWGAGKARAVRALASEHDLDLERSFAYSNGAEDVPFLETSGIPVAVEPEGPLAEEAQRRGWPILRCHAGRGRIDDAVAAARTVGLYTGMATAAGWGLGLGLLNRSRKTMLEVTGGVGADIGLATAGVNVEVVSGQEHLWSSRPCVFVFNHQSKLDPIIMMKLLRSGFTGVAKKEAANVPGFGQFFRLAGVAFIDRANIRDAQRALQPAVDKIREDGLSLVIAPEGTRSATPRLGPFKKGAFHIAMQAEVPMVPIVFRNVGEVMWRGSQSVRPGTVEAVVLDPVDTSSWKRESITDHVREVREMFLTTLADWPTRPVAPQLVEGRR